jgi:hypothetical protein
VREFDDEERKKSGNDMVFVKRGDPLDNVDNLEHHVGETREMGGNSQLQAIQDGGRKKSLKAHVNAPPHPRTRLFGDHPQKVSFFVRDMRAPHNAASSAR